MFLRFVVRQRCLDPEALLRARMCLRSAPALTLAIEIAIAPSNAGSEAAAHGSVHGPAPSVPVAPRHEGRKRDTRSATLLGGPTP